MELLRDFHSPVMFKGEIIIATGVLLWEFAVFLLGRNQLTVPQNHRYLPGKARDEAKLTAFEAGVARLELSHPEDKHAAIAARVAEHHHDKWKEKCEQRHQVQHAQDSNDLEFAEWHCCRAEEISTTYTPKVEERKTEMKCAADFQYSLDSVKVTRPYPLIDVLANNATDLPTSKVPTMLKDEHRVMHSAVQLVYYALMYKIAQSHELAKSSAGNTSENGSAGDTSGSALDRAVQETCAATSGEHMRATAKGEFVDD